MMIDSHLHLDLYPFGELGSLVQEARAGGVRGCLLAGVWHNNIETWLAWAGHEHLLVLKRSEIVGTGFPETSKYFVLPSLGLHPVEVAKCGSLNVLRKEMACFQEKAHAFGEFLFAVGETGFDFRDSVIESSASSKGGASRGANRGASREEIEALQWEAFLCCVNVAVELGLPVVLHSVNAWEVTLRGIELALSKGVKAMQIHSFSGSAEQAQFLVSRGVYLGFGGVATWQKARRVKEAFVACPEDKLLIETDGPDQPLEYPDGQRPARHDPKMLVDVFELLAQQRQCSAPHLAKVSAANLQRFLNL